MKRTTHDYYSKAAEILGRFRIGTLATVSRTGEPWNTPILIERDHNLQLYWFSDRVSQHARNVRQNSHVFIVFYDSTVGDGQGRRGGLYVKATARELNDPQEIRQACAVRKPDPDYPEQFMGSSNRRVYTARPEVVWINDVQIENGVFVRDFRVRLSIAKLRSYIKDLVA